MRLVCAEGFSGLYNYVTGGSEHGSPRSKIFAALGFLQLDERYRGVIIPDYQISVQELFIKVMTVLLSEFQGLEILTKRGEDSRWMKDLPT